MKGKRVEVRLSLPVVAPLLDVIKSVADHLHGELAAPLAMTDLDEEFHDSWNDELLSHQTDDVQTLLALFDHEFFANGVIAFDEGNSDAIVRACAAVRLKLRAGFLTGLTDETLESGDIELTDLEEPIRRAFMCYLFLATVQELIIQHLDTSIHDS